MDVTVKASEFAGELALAARVAETKGTTIPALAYVRMEVNGEARMRIAATDLDITLLSGCPVTVQAPGAVVLPARRLHDLTRLLPGDSMVRIQASEKSARLTADEYDGRMQTLPASDYPLLPQAPAVAPVRIPAKALSEALRQVQPAIAHHDARYFTDGALLELSGGTAMLVSTDGNRLSAAAVKLAEPVAEPASVLVPKKAVRELQAMLAESDGDAMFEAGENHLFFAVGDRVVATRKIDGKFPAYQRVIPTKHDKRIEVDRSALEAALRRLAITVDDSPAHAVRLVVANGEAKVSGVGPEIGDATEKVRTQSASGGDVEVAFNVNYMLDSLTAAVPGFVSMEFKDANAAILLTQLGNGLTDYRSIVMPVRA